MSAVTRITGRADWRELQRHGKTVPKRRYLCVGKVPKVVSLGGITTTVLEPADNPAKVLDSRDFEYHISYDGVMRRDVPKIRGKAARKAEKRARRLARAAA